MKIGIAARDLSRSGAGVGTYVTKLVEHLVREDQVNDYVLFCRSEEAARSVGGAETQSLNSKNKLIWDYALLPRAVRRHQLDLLFCPKNILPFGAGVKSVITVHDLAYYENSFRAYKWLDTMYMRRMIRSSVRRADGIIAISEHTKKDILRTFEVPESTPIKVIHEAASPAFSPGRGEDILAACRRKYALEGPFFFYAGSISPRKNLERTVRAFARIAGDIPHSFVITGGRRWGGTGFLEEVNDSGVSDRVRILGQVSEDDLISLYSMADFSVYPSLYEGFGLPIVEAMSCGCPVACADSTCLPEVAGEAALFFDPLSEDSIAEALLSLASNSKIADYYRDKAIRRAAEFSWPRVAKETIDFFNEIGEG
jgi:glycosyltransferase involved in cell wall biosynthesis